MATHDTIGTALLDDFREHPIPFCLRRAHSVRERRLRRRLFSAHERRTNARLEGFTRTWRRGNVVRQARQGWVRHWLWCMTWYKVEPTIVTGSNILDTRRYAIIINHYSGTMVRGKFNGAVTNIEADGKRSQPTSVNGANRPSRHKKATPAPTLAVRATPMAEQTPTPSSERIIIDTPERTSALATPTPAPEQTPSPIAQEPQTAVPLETATLSAKQMEGPPKPAPEQSPSPIAQEAQTAVPPQRDTLVAKQMATPPSEQQARQPDARTTTVPTPIRV